MFFNFHKFMNFFNFLSVIDLTAFLHNQRCVIPIFLNILRLNFWQTYGQLGKCPMYTWEGACFCCCLVFCTGLLDLIGFLCYSSPLYPELSSVWLFYPLLTVGWWSLQLLLNRTSISLFNSANFCFIYFGDLLVYTCL